MKLFVNTQSSFMEVPKTNRFLPGKLLLRLQDATVVKVKSENDSVANDGMEVPCFHSID